MVADRFTDKTTNKITVGILGASGYGGVQLLRLLQDHPHVEVAYLGGEQSAGKLFSDLYPHLAFCTKLKIEPLHFHNIAARCQVVFLSLPDGLAQGIVPTLMEKGCQVLDLSADYRFSDLETYQTWYGGQRSDHHWVQQAVYGLPEIYRDRLRNAQLIGCPGHYPTASLLALAPLIRQGLINLETIVVDGKGGTSGEGRQQQTPLLFAEAGDSILPYGVARDRHTPEIEQVCSDLAGQSILVQFTPHRVPMVRGMLTTVYARLRDPGLVREDLITIYSAFYRNAPWVEVLPNGIYPQTKWACGTNLCYIGIEVDPRTDRVIVMAAIDNLIKGQAGQAIQCLNLRMGWQETIGLPRSCFYP
jgi:N-acetyl-gamma-glutamyl-phosphate reductase